jgi:hypothetical protein
MNTDRPPQQPSEPGSWPLGPYTTLCLARRHVASLAEEALSTNSVANLEALRDNAKMVWFLYEAAIEARDAEKNGGAK